jgi:hypothetical protein
VAILMRGLGIVQAFNMVTIRSRVDGNIFDVAFRQGQFVHKGDLLMQIDTRPFQAQQEEAQGNLAKDQASLENAQRDLARYAVSQVLTLYTILVTFIYMQELAEWIGRRRHKDEKSGGQKPPGRALVLANHYPPPAIPPAAE